MDGDLLFANETIDAASGWRQLNVHNAAFEIADGQLASTYVKKGSWAYAVRELDARQTDVSIGGQFTSSGSGYYGWLCGDSSTGRYYGAVPQTDGSLVFIDGGYNGVEPLERYDKLGVPVPSQIKTSFGLECAIDHGTLWMVATVNNGEPVAVHEAEDVIDVSTFDILGMYGESLDPPFTTAVTNVVAHGTHDATGSVSFAALPLISYAQPAAASTETGEVSCTETPITDGAAAAVNCYLQDEGEGPELLRLATYPDAAALRAAIGPQDEPSNCLADPTATLWARGFVRCVAQTVGVTMEWTDTSLNVMGRLTDFDGDYGSLGPVWTAITNGS